MTLIQAFDCFIREKRLAGLSAQSIADYQYMLIGFIRFVGASALVESLTFDLVSQYILWLYRQPLSRATVSTYIRNVRIFLCFVADLVPLSFSPKRIQVPKSPKKKLWVYSDAEVVQIFEAVKTSLPWLTARNRSIIALMLDSGIRQGEVCSLRLSDIDFASGRMRVHGKGNKDRFVGLGRLTGQFLQLYLSLCPYPIQDRVFLESDGSLLTGNAVRLFIYRLGKQLPFEISSHKLRHNFATNWCMEKWESGGQVDATTLQILMGHSSIITTQNYIHCALEQMAVKSSVSRLDKLSGLFSDMEKARNSRIS